MPLPENWVGYAMQLWAVRLRTFLVTWLFERIRVFGPADSGIMLAQKLVDELIYDEHGNDVILIKYLDPRAASAP